MPIVLHHLQRALVGVHGGDRGCGVHSGGVAMSYGEAVEAIVVVVALNSEGKCAWIDVGIFIKALSWLSKCCSMWSESGEGLR